MLTHNNITNTQFCFTPCNLCFIYFRFVKQNVKRSALLKKKLMQKRVESKRMPIQIIAYTVVIDDYTYVFMQYAFHRSHMYDIIRCAVIAKSKHIEIYRIFIQRYQAVIYCTVAVPCTRYVHIILIYKYCQRTYNFKVGGDR